MINYKIEIRYILFIFILSFASCKQKVVNNFDEKSIIGEWACVKEIPLKKTDNIFIFQGMKIKEGYDFQPNNICETKNGYFKWVKEDESKYLFLGTKTEYKIESDSLKIFNLSKNIWASERIISIKGDTMTLEKDSIQYIFAKSFYPSDNNEHYDEIIISSSGCYGDCPINDICIKKNGEVLFNGARYNTFTGFYKSKVDSSIFKNIENNFKKAKIKNLQNEYTATWTDDETISVSFIKDNKIVKSVVDYGRQSPVEFIWAYTTARYLYQTIPLDSLSNPLNYLPEGEPSIYSAEKSYELCKAEGFYLWTLLLKSKKSSQNPSCKYSIKSSWDENQPTIETNGQFFKIKQKNGSIKTYDIGFNFITLNEFDNKLK